MRILIGVKCIAELRDKAEMVQDHDHSFIHVLDAEVTVVKSDTQIPESLRRRLIEAVHPLEDVPERWKDWHPNSDEQVLDLLHPSLYPVILGRSRAIPDRLIPVQDCLKSIGKGDLIAEDGLSTQDKSVFWNDSVNYGDLVAWGHFQWLPSEMEIGDDGKTHIRSYINNLHPIRHQQLYSVLESFVDRCIPLWNETLSWFHDRIRVHPKHNDREDWIVPDGLHWDRSEVVDDPCVDEDCREEDHAMMTDGEWADHFGVYDEYMDWRRDNRVLKQPEPDAYESWKKKLHPDRKDLVDLRSKFKDDGLQIIFKLANIHLTPEKPEFNGGSWHVEGALNEHICASAIYYYDEENISESRLGFRQPLDEDEMCGKPEQV
jgi:hypothetical protein